MPSPANAIEPCAVPGGEPATPDATVLDRVAARVRRRLAAERSETSEFGDGTHAASLILPLPR
ncbi:HaaA family cyclophane-containing RiPP peptide [Streptomyces sp. LaBMicrA B280]|uniref:HaaA family cyclophane-containing RiPP peptide n=1 Tax=Streptomyces sp. LaBMicrA B280 TaxID=3391001 RepID=UPI003BA66737